MFYAELAQNQSKRRLHNLLEKSTPEVADKKNGSNRTNQRNPSKKDGCDYSKTWNGNSEERTHDHSHHRKYAGE